MDYFLVAILALIAVYILRSREQSQHIRLLATHLSRYRIEKLMEQLIHNYMRALDEQDSVRRSQILELQHDAERELAGQVDKFAQDFQRVPAAEAKISKSVIPLPYTARLFPNQTFDMRALLVIHAQGIQSCAANEAGLDAKTKAFRMTAELFLFQHSCHWFCKSKPIASARMMARHKTRYDQAVDSVAPQTRRAYLKLIEG